MTGDSLEPQRMTNLAIAVTADLHWGHSAQGDEATRLLVQHLLEQPPELLLVGGDLGTGEHFEECLELFRDLPCPKALVPGNHDLWVAEDDARGDSLQIYEERLPMLCELYGFHYLDNEPLSLAQGRVAVVGTINWYDYSWSLERLQREVPDWEWRLRNMAFTRGRHNDRRFIRWPLDDVRFTARVVAKYEEHLQAASRDAEQVIVLTHHPAFYELNFPRQGPPSVPDGLLWDAFAGNTRLPQALERHRERVACVFSGHTHRAREARLGDLRGINIGGDYRWKRLVRFDWRSGAVDYFEFGDR
jgi:predicted MPP superfamily phosphohydrolase